MILTFSAHHNLFVSNLLRIHSTKSTKKSMAASVISSISQFQQIGILANEVFGDIMDTINVQIRKIHAIKARINKLEKRTNTIDHSLSDCSPSTFYDYDYYPVSNTSIHITRYLQKNGDLFNRTNTNRYLERWRNHENIQKDQTNTDPLLFKTEWKNDIDSQLQSMKDEKQWRHDNPGKIRKFMAKDEGPPDPIPGKELSGYWMLYINDDEQYPSILDEYIWTPLEEKYVIWVNKTGGHLRVNKNDNMKLYIPKDNKQPKYLPGGSKLMVRCYNLTNDTKDDTDDYYVYNLDFEADRKYIGDFLEQKYRQILSAGRYRRPKRVEPKPAHYPLMYKRSDHFHEKWKIWRARDNCKLIGCNDKCNAFKGIIESVKTRGDTMDQLELIYIFHLMSWL